MYFHIPFNLGLVLNDESLQFDDIFFASFDNLVDLIYLFCILIYITYRGVFDIKFEFFLKKIIVNVVGRDNQLPQLRSSQTIK